MGKYLKLFNNHNEYTAFTQTDDFVKPNVSHCIQENEVHYNPIPPMWGSIDLGLPSGTLWARMNVGATSETDFGNLYSWGGLNGNAFSENGTIPSGTKQYGWNDYELSNGGTSSSSPKLTKYYPSGQSAAYYADGFTGDTLVTLEVSDDVAYAESNGQYRIPTQAQCLELASETTNGFLTNGTFTLFAWSDENGYAEPTTSTTSFADTKLSGATGQVYFRNGVTAYTDAISSGEYVFLPACGSAGNGSVYDVGQWGSYWSGSLDEASPNGAWSLDFDAARTGVSSSSRCYGGSVRGVLNQ